MKAALLVIALLVAPSLRAQSSDPSAALGEWWTPGFGARVRIDACTDGLCGRIVWVWDEASRDTVDKAPLPGRKVIEGMRAAEPGRWTGGRLYNPEDGRDYRGSLHLSSPTQLVVEGCALFICKRQVWRRANPDRCPPTEPVDTQR